MIRRIVLFVAASAPASAAHACSVCMSSLSDDPANVALRASILCLLSVTLIVLGSFAKFFLGIRRRERQLP